MVNVYVEPQPKGRPEGSPVTGYILELAGGRKATDSQYKTQEEAIEEARKLGHKPLVARVINTDKGNPDHWRAA